MFRERASADGWRLWETDAECQKQDTDTQRNEALSSHAYRVAKLTPLSIPVVVIVLETICKASACKGSRRGIFDVHHLQCLCQSFLLTERHRFLSESERERKSFCTSVFLLKAHLCAFYMTIILQKMLFIHIQCYLYIYIYIYIYCYL